MRSSETQVSYHRRRLEELKQLRQPWEAEWQALAEFVEPTRFRMFGTGEGTRSRKKIVDSSGSIALRTLKNGMHSGLTSPARPWFRLSTFDKDLKDYDPVKRWLAEVTEIMRQIFQASNLYPAFHTGFGDLGQFGQSCAILSEDDATTIRMQQLITGRYWIARDNKGRATTLYRVFRWSVIRIVQEFGLANVPESIRTLYDTSKYGDLFDVYHAIEPREIRDVTSIAKQHKPFLSNYWMDAGRGSDNDGLLRESGFDENPIICPGWEISDDDHYSDSPAHAALGDIKMLQVEQTRKLEGIDKKVRPPMTAPTSLMNNPTSLLPGSVTYVDDPTGKGYRPAMEVNLDLNELREDIQEVQKRIDKVMFADLFFAITQMEGVQPRNTLELTQRKEEQLLQLGPVLENVYNGQLAPTIDRTFNIMARRRMLPPPPPELRGGTDLKVEYTGMLAQAQQAAATGAIERGVGFLGQLSAAKPEALDKLDADETIELYFDMIGAPPSMLADDDKVKAIRDQRAQQMQAAQQAEMAAQMGPALNQGAQAAQVLASAGDNPSGNSLLQQIGLT
jgi:hypothetical protein